MLVRITSPDVRWMPVVALCSHLAGLRRVKVACSSRSHVAQTADDRANAPAFSADIPSLRQPANVSLPNRKDIPWLTMISRNLRPIGRTVSRWMEALARAAWGLSSRASSSYLSCSTLSSAALAFQTRKTQAPLRLPIALFQSPLNNSASHHSPRLTEGATRVFGLFASKACLC